MPIDGIRRCTICGMEVPQTIFWCPACGTMVASDPRHEDVRCEFHPDQCAEGFCEVCSKPLCAECLERRDGKAVCRDPLHAEMLSSWVCVVDSLSEFEVDMVARNLELADIQPRVFFRRAHAGAILAKEFTGGRVYVPRSQSGLAAAAITILLEDSTTIV